MEAQGYEIKKGKYISFRAPGQERFSRAKTLGEDYAEEAIKQKISQKPAPIADTIPSAPADTKTIIKPLIDIENNQKISGSRGLEHWAKVQKEIFV